MPPEPERIPADAPLRPLLDRVLIRRIEADAAADGFAIPEKYRQHSNLGVVIALGDGVVLGGQWKPLTDFVSVGSKIIYGEYTAEAYDHNGQTYWIVRLQDIRGVVRE